MTGSATLRESKIKSWMASAGAALGVLAVLVVVSVLASVLVVAWQIANLHTKTVADETSQNSLFVSAVGLVVSVIVAVATVLYVVLTRKLVTETIHQREQDRKLATDAFHSSESERVERVAAAMLASATDVVGTSAILRSLARTHRVWNVRAATERLTQAVLATARALEELRLIAPPTTCDAAEQLMDAVSTLFEISTAVREHVEGASTALTDARQKLRQTVRLQREETIQAID